MKTRIRSMGASPMSFHRGARSFLFPHLHRLIIRAVAD